MHLVGRKQTLLVYVRSVDRLAFALIAWQNMWKTNVKIIEQVRLEVV